MKRIPILAAVLLALVLLAPAARAATLAPVKAYVKPGEPIQIRFLEPAPMALKTVETGDKPPIPAGPVSSTMARSFGQEVLDAVGLDAAKIPGLFVDAPATEVVDAAGARKFALYSFDGKKIDPAKLTPSKTPADLYDVYPQLKDAGTYILTWKDSTPLVINVLRNPIPWGMLARFSPQQQPLVRAKLLEKQKNDPVAATHIVALEYALIATDKGDMKATFAYDAAPNTVANFIALSKQKFYDGSAFHRIIKDFMIQGGDSMARTDQAGVQARGYQITAEISDKKHERGTLSMARTDDINSAGSQFFIMHAKKDFLDGNYTAFGQLIGGIDVVDKIVAETPTHADADGSQNGATNPKDRPAIKSITIFPATLDQYGIKK